ncbi:VOC family protein [Halorubrum sp. DTA46]|uniref:VOC family protein n=1 Tax=Halorubrum sp. DTA46 TaxID=3402162 RepID=UPI003AAC203F
MPITGLDHVVVTVSDVEAAVDFYTRLPGIEHVTYGGGGDGPVRHALRFGDQKINLHEAGDEIEPRASAAEPGDSDLCLLTDADPAALVAEVEAAELRIELGPVERTGARGTLASVYIRDPDGSLIEIATYA